MVLSLSKFGRLTDKYGKIKVFTVFMSLDFIPIGIITNLGVTPIGYVLLVSTLFLVSSNGRLVPAAAMITGTAKPENRSSFLCFNSAIQQLGSGVTSFIGGMILFEGTGRCLTNFEWIGYWAFLISLLCFPLIRKIKVVDAESNVSSELIKAKGNSINWLIPTQDGSPPFHGFWRECMWGIDIPAAKTDLHVISKPRVAPGVI